MEKDQKFVQDLVGAGRELKSLDAQSWKVFVTSGTTRFIVSLENSVLEGLIVSSMIFLGPVFMVQSLMGCFK